MNGNTCSGKVAPNASSNYGVKEAGREIYTAKEDWGEENMAKELDEDRMDLIEVNANLVQKVQRFVSVNRRLNAENEQLLIRLLEAEREIERLTGRYQRFADYVMRLKDWIARRSGKRK